MGRTPLVSSESKIQINIQSSTTTTESRKGPLPPQYYNTTRFRKWVPWLVPTIIIANIVIFVITMHINNCPANSSDCLWSHQLGAFSFESPRVNPLLGPSASTLVTLGAMQVEKVVNEHQVWRLATCMWLHAGVVHIMANMISLLFVGIRLEQEFGFVRIGLLYVISGVGGSLASSLFLHENISVGASGALFGFLGSMLSELFINWTIYDNKCESLFSLIIIIVINMAVGILPHVDNFAHLGGFCSGFLLGFVLLIRPQFGWVNAKKVPPGYSMGKSKYKPYQYFLLVMASIVLVVGFTIGITMLVRGIDGNEHCSWCHYLSCVPTPLWSCEAQCQSSQLNNQLNLTCLQNHKSRFYMLDPSANVTSQIQQLCAELCGP